MARSMERAPLGGPAAWTGVELENDDSWIWQVDDTAVAAFDGALAAGSWRRVSVAGSHPRGISPG